jgi:hypothetical protein
VDGRPPLIAIACGFDFMKPRPPFRLAVCIGAVFLSLAQSVFAHAPFDCSARVIVHEDSTEVMVNAGSTLGEFFLHAAQLTPDQLPNGHGRGGFIASFVYAAKEPVVPAVWCPGRFGVGDARGRVVAGGTHRQFWRIGFCRLSCRFHGFYCP